MDPLAQLRGDVPVLSPLDRARLAGTAAEEREWKQTETARAEAVERFQTNLAQQAAVERSELMAQGYTNRELREHQQQADALRQERVAELEAELARIDPRRRQAVARSQADQDRAALLRRAKAVKASPVVQRMIDQAAHDEEVRRNERVQAQIRRLEDEGYEPPQIWR